MPPPLLRRVWLSRSPAETEWLGRLLGGRLLAGDAVLLRSAVASGKSVFARGIVRGAAGDASLSVPSPSFCLAATYALRGGAGDALHIDCHRLRRGASAESAAALLGLPAAWRTALCVVEWPQRLGAAVPPARIDVRVLAEGVRGYAAAAQRGRALSHGAAPPPGATLDGGGVYDSDAVQPRAVVIEARGERLARVLSDVSRELGGSDGSFQ